MTSVCKWLGFYLCMKEPSVNLLEKHHLNALQGSQYKCDMLITLKESKESSGGLAFDVILKPPVLDNPPIVFMKQHSPTRDISQEDIDKKLKEAEDRRLALESQKLLTVQKSKERAMEANQRVQDLNDSFIKEVGKKLHEKMEVSAEMKTQQIKLLQEKLKEHAQRVEIIRKIGEQSREELKERIEKKLETAWEKRESQLACVQERIRQHQKHIEEVIECSNKFSRDTEERIIIKMENSLKNREEHLNSLMERLKKHEQHIRDIRQNKMNQSSSSDEISPTMEDFDFNNMTKSFTNKVNFHHDYMNQEAGKSVNEIYNMYNEEEMKKSNATKMFENDNTDEFSADSKSTAVIDQGNSSNFEDAISDFEKVSENFSKDEEEFVDVKNEINIKIKNNEILDSLEKYDSEIYKINSNHKDVTTNDNDDDDSQDENIDDDSDADGDDLFPPPPPLSSTANEALLL